MLTLLGAILGLITSSVPALLALLQGRQDKAHEFAMAELQMEMLKRGHTQRLEEIQTQADIAESAALYRPLARSGVKWIDGWSAMIRPGVTTLFVLAYLAVKAASFHLMLVGGPDMMWSEAVTRLWNSEDMAVFMTILGYWFGARILAKFREGRA